MAASDRDAGSSVIVEVPTPWNRAAVKIQPSVARVNANSARGPEIADTASRSATRLFRLVSTGAADADAATLPKVPKIIGNRNGAIGVLFMGIQPSSGAFE